jgi:hypothetical protein
MVPSLLLEVRREKSSERKLVMFPSLQETSNLQGLMFKVPIHQRTEPVLKINKKDLKLADLTPLREVKKSSRVV